MMNQVAANEALFSATYVDSYIDSVENLPDDVQRHLSRIRDIDVRYRNLLIEVDHYYDLWKSLQNSGESAQNKRNRASMKMQHNLIAAQELGDEKMQIVNQLQELIDMKTRQLDTNQKNLDIKEEECAAGDAVKMEVDEAATPPKQSRTQSPMRGVEMSLANGNAACGGNAAGISERHNSNGGPAPPSKEAGFSGAFGTSAATTAAEQATERSVNSSLGSSSNNNSNSNLCSAENPRSASKRTRRRNENSAMELGGNESNSATEAGSNGGGGSATQAAAVASQERNVSLQKSSSSSGLAVAGAANQKKNTLGSAASGTTAVSNIATGATSSNSASGSAGNNNSGKKKKRKTRGGAGGQSSSAQTNAREETPPPDPIDPDEPTYCVCNQISFGEMILCDNDLCPIEWFHFSCVSLVSKPKGKWFCPNCRGDRPNVMKPKAQFLKELERYNKEKEEKT